MVNRDSATRETQQVRDEEKATDVVDRRSLLLLQGALSDVKG